MPELMSSKHSPLKDSRLDDPLSQIEIVFDGSITLWRSGTNLDVIVLFFEQFQCMELIVYNPIKNCEAPRIYIDFKTLEKHLPRAEMQAKIDERKELFLRRHRTYVANVIEKEVELNIMSNYIVSRIAIKEDENFEIQLQAHFGDTIQEDDAIEKGITTHHLDFVIHKPDGLVPIFTEHFVKPNLEQFERKLTELKADQQSAQNNFAIAHRLLRIVELAANAFQGAKSYNTNPSLSVASCRWKRSINRVINMIMCERFRRQLQKKQSDALLKKALDVGLSDPRDLNIKGLGPLNECGLLSSAHRSKFENHLPKTKQQRAEEVHHPPIHILAKSDSHRQSFNGGMVMTDEITNPVSAAPKSAMEMLNQNSNNLLINSLSVSVTPHESGSIISNSKTPTSSNHRSNGGKNGEFSSLSSSRKNSWSSGYSTHQPQPSPSSHVLPILKVSASTAVDLAISDLQQLQQQQERDVHHMLPIADDGSSYKSGKSNDPKKYHRPLHSIINHDSSEKKQEKSRDSVTSHVSKSDSLGYELPSVPH